MNRLLEDLPISRKQAVSIVEADARANVWDGAIRSGKTISSILRWQMFVADPPPGGQLIMVGRTRDSLARNVIEPMRDPALFGPLAYRVSYTVGAGTANILGRRVYVLGASDVKAEKSLRGLTVAGAYLDEITVIQEDFFKQVLGRMSLDSSKLFGTTNPDSPNHWLKKDYLDRIRSGQLPDWRTWRFTLDDNPALSEEKKNQYKREYTGLWYRRFVLGEWVAADGAVYDSWDETRHVIAWDRLPVMQDVVAVGVDYGTTNPTSAILLGVGVDGVLYLIDEYRYQASSDAARLTDGQLSAQIRTWLAAQHLPPHPATGHVQASAPGAIVVDPAAASFRVQLREDGVLTAAADNDVLYGIRLVSSLLGAGKLRVSTRCTGFLSEVTGYSWDSKATEQGIDAPIKVADHSLDAARYAIATTERRWRPYIDFAAEPRPPNHDREGVTP
ncbi:PBSX family phage terminase large subunit [Nocardia terpenica]|uniref:Terminase n=1 Tax=Nocardia terpenica TaxID=455432 RepID=A0A164H2C8_9NOCA|nr:PBSX family phage terminase large subunit [Nocardia terpenica]KZM68142.1 terminase [Nocardia terpenica]NQE88999.1 PBSX family phage terminase large subunit [Nocardia terpenica]